MSNQIIIVDEEDNPIGSKYRNEMRYEDIYRISALWLSDRKTNKILLAQRKLTKKNDPGKWGPAVAGTLEINETYENNIQKETEEEIGLTDLKFMVGPKTFNDEGIHKFFCQWFLADVDKDIVIIKVQEEELEAIKWVTESWLKTNVAQNPQNYTHSFQKNLRALGID